MRGYLYAFACSALWTGCVTTNSDSVAESDQARAEIRVDTAALSAAAITRVSVESDGSTADLSFNPMTGGYDGSLILASGPHSVVASAFAGDQLIGRSQPGPVSVAAGVITRVELRMLDLRPDAAPLFGPIVDTLSFPTTTNAGAAASFAIAAVAPGGDPLTYAWTTDCLDATFSAPAAATTTWSKPAQGTCNIAVTVTSNSLSVHRSFGIVVFPSGAATGAAGVSAELITAPKLVWSFAPGTTPVSQSNASCSVMAGDNASCQFIVASPQPVAYHATVVDWGGGVPGTLTVSDDCGGRFGLSSQSFDDRIGFWLPPLAGDLCILTARATSGDGLTSSIAAAVVADAGAPPAVTQPPAQSATLFYSLTPNQQGTIFLSNPPPALTMLRAGVSLGLSDFVNWADGLPGTVTVVDSCVGAQPVTVFDFGFGVDTDVSSQVWTAPTTQGVLCTITVQATNLQGVASTVSGQYQTTAP
jgi:hypothetical protein